MSHVAGVCSAPIVAEVRSRGLDVEGLVEGLGLRLAAFEDRNGRIPWRAFVPFAQRAEKMLGADVIEDLAAEATVSSVPAPIRRLLPRIADSRTVFVLAPRWWGPRVFHGTSGICERLPDGRLREVVKIRPELEACPEFFSGLQGTLRAIPRLTGQPDALVELEQDGRVGEFLITPPPRRVGIARRLGRRWLDGSRGSGIAAAKRELEELGFAAEQALDDRRRLETTTAALDRERRHRKSLQDLGQLLIRHQDADLESLQRGIVQVLIERDEIIGARLWRRGPDADPARVVAGGRTLGPPDRNLALSVGDREVGELSLWAALEGDDLEAIESLACWIAFAIEYGSSRALNAHLVEVLSEDVRSWRGMEERLERLASRWNGPRSDRD